MNPLRLIATVLAFVMGIWGAVIALTNWPSARALGPGPVPAYVWMNIVTGVLGPLALVLGGATALLLLARIDRRLDQLQSRSN
jgi:hypothetical protein